LANKVIELKGFEKNLKVVWIHGDHLLMVPFFIRVGFAQANIGFYFHSPWPASAVFNTF
jgi:trehalose 6-phosphate synthase